MARKHDNDAAFGSDSFLDIVANVVGILIILIIIAGVRVGRAPLVVRTAPATIEPEGPPAPPSAPPVPPVAAIDPPPLPPPQAASTTWPDDPFTNHSPPPAPRPQPRAPETIIVERPLPPLPPVEAPRELLAESDRLRQSIADLEAERSALEQKLKGSAGDVESSRRQLAQLQQSAQEGQSQVARERDDLAAGERELAETLARLEVLRRNLDAEANRPPDTTVIQHRVTPIGRIVRGQELHFLLSGGRVTPVPVDELARRLSAQVERQKDMLAKLQSYEGELDVVDGFRMKYVIQRSRLSLAEELKYGQHVIRMGVTQWTLIPEPGMPSESLEAALQRGSRFYQALLSAGPNATLTLWTYPDSFDTCQEIKEFAHRHGYEVAARPLPFGVFITGSPDGSRSVAQ